MTAKEKLIENLENVTFEHVFLENVFEKWLEELQEYDEHSEILGDIKDTAKYSAIGGQVTFVVYTQDNKQFIEDHDYNAESFCNYMLENYGINYYNDPDAIMWRAVELCAITIGNSISLSEHSYEDDRTDREVFIDQLKELEESIEEEFEEGNGSNAGFFKSDLKEYKDDFLKNNNTIDEEIQAIIRNINDNLNILQGRV